MKHILVTGGAGYIGSHVVRALMQAGFVPIVFDNLSTGHRAAVNGNLLIEGNIGSWSHLDQVFKDLQIDAVVHMAGSCSVSESVIEPRQYLQNNLVSGLTLLNVMLENQVTDIVFSSSAAVYGNAQSKCISEADQTNPTNPYGYTKLAFERILAQYETAYGVRHMSLRYFNAAGADLNGAIGEDHRPETHVIPSILEVALNQRPHLEIHGLDYPTEDGSCIRDFVHVEDLARAHVLALQALRDGKPSTAYNVGSERGFSVWEVVETARRVTQRPILTRGASRRAGDPARLVASATKIRHELGWHPRYPELATMIETAWNWRSAHPDGYESTEQPFIERRRIPRVDQTVTSGALAS